MKLSIVIVEYNDLISLSNVLHSIYKNVKCIEYEIIVVSNSNYNFSKQKDIKNLHDNVIFIFNSTNRGFAKAVNQGLRLSEGDYVLIINPDALLLDDNIISSLMFLEKNPKICAVGPRIINHQGEVQDSLRLFLSLKTLITRTYERIKNRLINKKASHKANPQLLEYEVCPLPHPVDWISGACMLIKKSAINKVGLMDERFFMYCEDMDWCRRFWKHNYEVWSFPDWVVKHEASRASSLDIFSINRLKIIHIVSIIKYFLKWSHV